MGCDCSDIEPGREKDRIKVSKISLSLMAELTLSPALRSVLLRVEQYRELISVTGQFQCRVFSFRTDEYLLLE